MRQLSATSSADMASIGPTIAATVLLMIVLLVPKIGLAMNIYEVSPGTCPEIDVDEDQARKMGALSLPLMSETKEDGTEKSPDEVVETLIAGLNEASKDMVLVGFNEDGHGAKYAGAYPLDRTDEQFSPHPHYLSVPLKFGHRDFYQAWGKASFIVSKRAHETMVKHFGSDFDSVALSPPVASDDWDISGFRQFEEGEYFLAIPHLTFVEDVDDPLFDTYRRLLGLDDVINLKEHETLPDAFYIFERYHRWYVSEKFREIMEPVFGCSAKFDLYLSK